MHTVNQETDDKNLTKPKNKQTKNEKQTSFPLFSVKCQETATWGLVHNFDTSTGEPEAEGLSSHNSDARPGEIEAGLSSPWVTERDAVLCLYFIFPPNIKVLEGKLWETTLRQVEGQAALGQTSRCSQDSPYRPRTVKPLKKGKKRAWKSSSQGGTFQQQVNTQQTLNLTSGQGNAK